MRPAHSINHQEIGSNGQSADRVNDSRRLAKRQEAGNVGELCPRAHLRRFHDLAGFHVPEDGADVKLAREPLAGRIDSRDQPNRPIKASRSLHPAREPPLERDRFARSHRPGVRSRAHAGILQAIRGESAGSTDERGSVVDDVGDRSFTLSSPRARGRLNQSLGEPWGVACREGFRKMSEVARDVDREPMFTGSRMADKR